MDARTCSSFAAGHQMHWIQWRQALAEDWTAASATVEADGVVDIGLVDGGRLHWWTHAPDELAAALTATGGAVQVVESLHALRVGAVMVNCSPRTSAAACKTASEARRW